MRGMIEMKLTIAALYTNFKTLLTEEYSDVGIEQEDGYNCGPEAQRLILQFKVVEE